MSEFTRTELMQEITVQDLVTIHYFEYTSDFYFPGEAHGFWEFLYVDKGQLEVTAGLKNITLKKGNIIFHKPFEFHKLKSNGIVAPNLVVISFHCDSPAMKFFENKILNLGDEERDLLGRIIDEAKESFSSDLSDPDLKKLERSGRGQFASEQVIKACLELLLIQIIRTQDDGSVKVTSVIREQAGNDMFHQIVAYLNKNIHSKITLEDICRDNLCGCSQLQKIFREKTGGGVMEYFGKIKIDSAKQAIREGKKNFTEIANDLGYSSIHYFSRHFKKIAGMTPSEYASSVKLLTENQKGKTALMDQ